MPLYVYKCEKCEDRYEVRHSIHADGPTTHDGCGGATRRVIASNPRVTFHGGQDFWHNNTIRTEAKAIEQSIRDSGGEPVHVGNRWI